MTSPKPILATPLLATVLLSLSAPAWAQEGSAQEVIRLRADIEAQSVRLAEQERLLAGQKAELAAQKAQLNRIDGQMLESLRAAGMRSDARIADADQAAPIVGAAPAVGQAPPEEARIEVASLPEGSGVLTPAGHWVIEPSLDFTHGSTNRLVFRGVEIVTGVQIGVIEASDADRNAVQGALTVRYGLTSGAELEVRVPYAYRSDRVTTLVQRDESATRTMHLEGRNIGDVEAAARYQINGGGDGWPVFIAGLRAKSDTGSSPFEIDRDAFGVSTELATGSGFWGVEPSISLIYPTDPAVIFGGLSYFAQLPKSINRQIGGVQVGRVDPGDSISASGGFGFALNPRFSFSLGYRHSYIFPTKTALGPTTQKSESLQVGAFTFGWSFRLSDRLTMSNTYEIGTTRDAPDMRFVLRFPYRF